LRERVRVRGRKSFSRSSMVEDLLDRLFSKFVNPAFGGVDLHKTSR
jgi:hypothetical protein